MIFEQSGLYTTLQTAKNDRLSHTIANALVGNEYDVPTFEMAVVPAAIYFEEQTLIALAGADYHAYTSERDVEMYKPYLINKGETLHFRRAAKGTRVYLAVGGGVIEDVRDQPIETGAVFKLAHHYSDIQKKLIHRLMVDHACPWGVDYYSLSRVYYSDIFHIRPGAAIDIPDDEVFEVTRFLSRGSYVIEGTAIYDRERPTAQLEPGSIQVTANQKLRIVLEHTEGQQAVAQVAPYHFSKLVQKRPGSKLIFKNVSEEEYEQRYASYENWLKSLLMHLSYKLKSYVDV
ncbi:hypothetical protein ERX37_08420 [Macrococcus hajekii]|uniref:Carboxyltransferase domain-containing protein n=1 Tax=Macrococcus hajekii TaxID=198482 RepID=A0A4R6BIV2_9STAP|nr:hypothetical protein [Macrococcus hajekii]TDM01510.1 hypothetical protein ERX37_08420 [Macrococcus hajekii]GGB00568.1 allophanate hydrolase [Macrococcus hajekii]